MQPAQKPPSLLGPSRFRFLNEAHDVVCASDWNRAEWDKLWLYNLHYFDDLNAQGAASRTAWHKALITKWIQENPVGQGNGWEPYPLSLRVVNWIKWVLAGNPLTAEQCRSLAMQVRWLAGRVEWHLLGNHLYTNGKALMIAGLFFLAPRPMRVIRGDAVKLLSFGQKTEAGFGDVHKKIRNSRAEAQRKN